MSVGHRFAEAVDYASMLGLYANAEVEARGVRWQKLGCLGPLNRETRQLGHELKEVDIEIPKENMVLLEEVYKVGLEELIVSRRVIGGSEGIDNLPIPRGVIINTCVAIGVGQIGVHGHVYVQRPLLGQDGGTRSGRATLIGTAGFEDNRLGVDHEGPEGSVANERQIYEGLMHKMG